MPIRSILLALFLLLAVRAEAQPVLDVAAVPGLDATGRAEYRRFLLANLPRAFAVSENGKAGWAGPAPSLDVARAVALERCATLGGINCRWYAENLDVVWGHRPPAVMPPPGEPLIKGDGYVFIADDRYFWHGPRAAAGVYVWSHGKGPMIDSDNRGLEPEPHVRPFNNAGYDVVRFDRAPLADNPDRAAGWLADGLRRLRAMGYRRVVAGGESRGGWTSLQMVDAGDAADVVIAVVPAAQGTEASRLFKGQPDALRQVVGGANAPRLRLAVIQFAADPYAGDLAERDRILSGLLGRVGGLLLIDRPDGLLGHGAAAGETFAERFGACLYRFASSPVAPSSC
ncbi:MAG: hypothetical protein J2P47_05665 [Acetobacteraceae bacterium]|nr:hypothetical protein [Acetobacteraceae bacterium]